MSQLDIQVNRFLDTVCSQIRCKKEHDSLRKELANHIADQAEHNAALGEDEITATKEAIESMGDPIVVGGQLDSVHRPKPKWSVIILAVVFILVGAGMRTCIGEIDVTFARWISCYLTEIIKILPLGILALVCGYWLDYTKIAKYIIIIYPVMIIGVFFLLHILYNL